MTPLEEETREKLCQLLELKENWELEGICGHNGIKAFKRKNQAALIKLILEACEKKPDLITQILGEGHGQSGMSEVETEQQPNVSWWEKPWNIVTGIATLIGLAIAVIAFTSKKQNSFVIDKGAFEKVDDAYNILILPFAPLQDCTAVDTHMEEAVKSRLMEMSRQDGLGLQVKFYQGTKCPRDFVEGREIGARLNADLVVWGDYYDVCSTELEACVKYAVVNQVAGVKIEGKSPTEPLKLSQIQEGKLQGDIDFIILWTLGTREYDRGKYQQALVYFENIDMEIGNLFFLIGHCYHKLEDFEKANAHYTQAIRYNGTMLRLNPQPEEAVVFFLRGNTYQELKNYNQAITDYDKAISLSPQFADAFSKRGSAYNSLGKYNQAITDCDEAIRLSPQYASAFCNRGNAYRDLEKYNQAIADYDEAIRLNPQNAAVFLLRGITNNAQRNYDQAIADYDEAIRLNPQDVVAFSFRGSTYNDLKNYDKAIADYNEAIRLNPQHAAAFIGRGATNQTLEKYRQAIEDYESFIRLIRLSGPELQHYAQNVKQLIEELRAKL